MRFRLILIDKVKFVGHGRYFSFALLFFQKESLVPLCGVKLLKIGDYPSVLTQSDDDFVFEIPYDFLKSAMQLIDDYSLMNEEDFSRERKEFFHKRFSELDGII